MEPDLVLVVALRVTAARARDRIAQPRVEVVADREPVGALAGEAVLPVVVTTLRSHRSGRRGGDPGVSQELEVGELLPQEPGPDAPPPLTKA